MNRVAISLFALLTLQGVPLYATTSEGKVDSIFANGRPFALILHDLKQYATNACPHGVSLLPDMQKEIWFKTFSLDVDCNASDLAVQFNSLADISLFALSLNSCMTNRTCLIQFADHLGRMSERASAVDNDAFRRAMEADEALGFGSKPMAREAGSRGISGPNMKRLKSKDSRLKHWNHCVALYRERVLGMFRQNLIQCGNFHDVFDDDFKMEFIIRAKLAPQWFKCIHPH